MPEGPDKFARAGPKTPKNFSPMGYFSSSVEPSGRTSGLPRFNHPPDPPALG